MSSGFPDRRMRRLRRTEVWRKMVAETRLAPEDFVYPMFAVEGSGVRNDVKSMPGVQQLSVDCLVDAAGAVHAAGVPSVILFGIPSEKDAHGSHGYDPEGIVPTAIRALKEQIPTLNVWADVCLCEYTEHGHCGLLTSEGEVDNDTTLPLLAKAARVYAEAGADAVAPSDMMDGRVRAIRDELDGANLGHVPIVSYAAKYASAFYGPFRETAESTPAFGDRRGYQMDPPNRREALREMRLDLEEGADMLMVKPALSYLDILADARRSFDVPLAAYHVSGEYAMIKAAGERGWIDADRAMEEALVSIKRAGADLILTYAAADLAEKL